MRFPKGNMTFPRLKTTEMLHSLILKPPATCGYWNDPKLHLKCRFSVSLTTFRTDWRTFPSLQRVLLALRTGAIEDTKERNPWSDTWCERLSWQRREGRSGEGKPRDRRNWSPVLAVGMEEEGSQFWEMFQRFWGRSELKHRGRKRCQSQLETFWFKQWKMPTHYFWPRFPSTAPSLTFSTLARSWVRAFALLVPLPGMFFVYFSKCLLPSPPDSVCSVRPFPTSTSVLQWTRVSITEEGQRVRKLMSHSAGVNLSAAKCWVIPDQRSCSLKGSIWKQVKLLSLQVPKALSYPSWFQTLSQEVSWYTY